MASIAAALRLACAKRSLYSWMDSLVGRWYSTVILEWRGFVGWKDRWFTALWDDDMAKDGKTCRGYLTMLSGASASEYACRRVGENCSLASRLSGETKAARFR